MIREMVSSKVALTVEIASSQLNHCSSLAELVRIMVTDKVPVSFTSKDQKGYISHGGRMISIEDLSEVFKIVFDDDEMIVNEESSANDVEGWDSMTHVLLLSAIEEKYGIEFNQKEVRKFQTVGDLLNSVNNKLR